MKKEEREKENREHIQKRIDKIKGGNSKGLEDSKIDTKERVGVEIKEGE